MRRGVEGVFYLLGDFRGDSVKGHLELLEIVFGSGLAHSCHRMFVASFLWLGGPHILASFVRRAIFPCRFAFVLWRFYDPTARRQSFQGLRRCVPTLGRSFVLQKWLVCFWTSPIMEWSLPRASSAFCQHVFRVPHIHAVSGLEEHL